MLFVKRFEPLPMTPARRFEKAQRLITVAGNITREGEQMLNEAESILTEVAVHTEELPSTIRERLEDFLENVCGLADENISRFFIDIDARLGVNPMQPVMLVTRTLVDGRRYDVNGMRIGLLNGDGLLVNKSDDSCSIAVHAHTRPSLDDLETDVTYGGEMMVFALECFNSDYPDEVQQVFSGSRVRMSTEPKYEIIIGESEIASWFRKRGWQGYANYFYQAHMLGINPPIGNLSEPEQVLLKQRAEREIQRSERLLRAVVAESQLLAPQSQGLEGLIAEPFVLLTTKGLKSEPFVLESEPVATDQPVIIAEPLTTVVVEKGFGTQYMTFADLAAEMESSGVILADDSVEPLQPSSTDPKMPRLATGIITGVPLLTEPLPALAEMLRSRGINPDADPDAVGTIALPSVDPRRPLKVRGGVNK